MTALPGMVILLRCELGILVGKQTYLKGLAPVSGRGGQLDFVQPSTPPAGIEVLKYEVSSQRPLVRSRKHTARGGVVGGLGASLQL